MPFYNSAIFGKAWTKTFNDIWQDPDTFWNDYRGSGLYAADNCITEDSGKLLFYLLTAKYGGSSIAAFDEDQFKYQVYSVIYKYGPTWEARIAAQSKIRALLNSEDLFKGTKQIYSIGINPGTVLTDEDIIEGVNEQRTSRPQRGKIEAYAIFMEALKTDVTERFLEEFKYLFRTIVAPQYPLYYSTGIRTQEDEYDV